MQPFSYLRSVLYVSLLFIIVSCGKKDKDDATTNGTPNVPQGAPSDREVMLTNIADNILIPAYANFDLKLSAMIAKGDAFRSSPSATSLTEFRSAWEEAYIEWQKVAIFDFGPANDNALNSFMNIYPCNVTAINTNISSGNANLEVFESYPTQGFPTLDYLLNGVGTTDNDIVAMYTTDVDAEKRKAYILQLTNQMNKKFTEANNAWKGEYRNKFVSSTGMGLFSSTSLMVNGIVFYYERFIRSGKFGIPSGVMVGGTVLPTSVEAYYKKDIGKKLAQTAHEAFADYFNGKSVKTGVENGSLKTYLNALGAQDPTTKVLLSETINKQFSVVTNKLATLNNDVASDNDKMIAVYNEMQLLVRLLKVDMTSAMSVTITYTDNDGD